MSELSSTSIEKMNIEFIKAVEKRPHLYNVDLEDYCRKSVTDNCWEEIAQQFDVSVEKCKDRWRNLRSAYVRFEKIKHDNIILDKQKRPRTKAKPYYLSKYMEFLKPYIQKDRSKLPLLKLSEQNSLSNQNFDDTVKIDDSNSDGEKIEFEEIIISQNPQCGTSSLSTSSNPKKRLNESTIDESISESFVNTTPNNSRAMFLMSLLPELNEMSEQGFRQFKRRVFMIIDDINCENII